MGRRLRSPELRNVVEVTMRTFQERLFLRPSAALNEVVLGALGRAQARYGLVIHQFVALSNHYHMLCSPTDPQQLARFMNFFNSKLAREIARLHNWRGRIWAGPYSAIRVSDEALAQVARCKYLLAQGCKEGFVATPGDWPGVNTVDALRYDTVLQGVWHDRTKEYNARRVCRSVASADFRSTEIVHLTPLPCWAHLDEESRRACVVELVRDVESETAAMHRSQGTRPSGARFILRQHPHERPHRVKRAPAPLVHAATAAVRRIFVTAYAIFLSAYRAAAERLRRGEPSVSFPDNCFPPRLPFVRGPA